MNSSIPQPIADSSHQVIATPAKGGDNTPNLNISNAEFLIAVFGDDWVYAHVTSFPEDPQVLPNDRRAIAWCGDYFHRYNLEPGVNQYFTVSIFNHNEKGRSLRQKALFLRQHCVVLDDVREKLSIEQAAKLPRPSWIMVTSEGSEQWGYILKTPCTDRKRLDNLTDGLIKSKLAPDSKDPGMRGVTRYMRLPEGTNNKASKMVQTPTGPVPFNVHITYWNIFAKHTLEQLAAPFGIDLNGDRPNHETNSNHVELVPDHPALTRLNIKSHDNKGQYEVTCPWLDEHTSPIDSDGTAVWTLQNYKLGFKCHHGHCEDKRGADLFKKISEIDSTFETEFKKWKIDKLFPGDNYESLNTKVTPTNSIQDHNHHTDDCGVVLNTPVIDAGLTELIGKLPLLELMDANVIRAAWESCYETRSNHKINIVKPDGSYYTQLKTASYASIKASFGDLVKLDKALEYFKNKCGSDEEAKKALGRYEKKVFGLFLTYLNKHKQIEVLHFEVDMFTNHSHMIMLPDNQAKVICMHRPFQVEDSPSPHVINQVIADFKVHFPQFELFVRILCASRFASDRRDAFIWFFAKSGWGKGFLLSVLTELNLVVELSIAEIEKALEGAPVGRVAMDFLRAWVLVVDEFKSIKSEVKMLNNRISASPKNQLNFTASLYLKLFLSAEIVDSLAGEAGVEEQFANRFSFMNPKTGKLDDRPLFISIGKQVYLKAVVTYMAKELNIFVQQMQGMGQIEAANHCDNVLSEFNAHHRLDLTFGTLDETVENVAHEIREILKGYPLTIGSLSLKLQLFLKSHVVVGEHNKIGDVVLLKSSIKFIKEWIYETTDRSQVVSMQKKAVQIADLLDPNWRENRRLKCGNGGSCQGGRGVMIKIEAVIPSLL